MKDKPVLMNFPIFARVAAPPAALALVLALVLPIPAFALTSGTFSDSRWYCM